MESTETKQHPNVLLQSCLANLFQAPTKGIEDAFKMLLDLIQNQNELKQESLLKLEQRNDELMQELTKCQESNQLLKVDLERNLEVLKGSISMLKDERDDLLKQNERLNFNQSSLEKRIRQMDAEVKTMAYNLQLDAKGEIDDLVEEASEAIPERKEDEAKHDDFIENKTENDKVSLDSEKETSREYENTDDKVQTAGDPIEDIDELKPKSKLPEKISHSSLSRASVISHKLQHHKTLAARLDRIENDKEKVKRELTDLKYFVANVTGQQQQQSPIVLSETSKNRIMEVHQRVVALEKFLEGFGVNSATLSCNHEEIQTNDEEIQTDPYEYNEKQLSVESIAVSSNRKRARSDDIKGGNALDNQSIPEESGTESAGGNKSKTEKNDVTMNIIPVVAEIDDCNESKDGHDVAHEKSDMNNVSNRRQTVNTDERKQSFRKSQSLLVHFIEQEKRFQEDTNSIHQRLFTLEGKIEKKACGESLEQIIMEVKSQLDQMKNVKSKTINYTLDHSPLASKVAQIEACCEELKKELDSKPNKSDLSKELERHQSDSILTSLQHGNNTIDGQALKQFQHMVQSKIDTLRDQKLDKVAFLKGVEETKSQILSNLTKSISSQEANLRKLITKAEIDILDCKNSVNMIENAVATKYADTGDFNLDEKIKSATEAMESNLQEIISSRMNCLKAMEEEVEKIATGLAEKPDQEQINNMLQNLEDTVLKRFGKDDTFQSVLESMKAELTQKTTRKEVLFLVKQMLNGAKEEVKRSSSNSLMIGHQAFKCLSCNEIHPQGVNNCLAPKVNHNSLPKGRGLVPTAYPYCSTGISKLGKGTLRPLYRPHSSLDMMRRSRRSTNSSTKYSRRSR